MVGFNIFGILLLTLLGPWLQFPLASYYRNWAIPKEASLALRFSLQIAIITYNFGYFSRASINLVIDTQLQLYLLLSLQFSKPWYILPANAFPYIYYLNSPSFSKHACVYVCIYVCIYCLLSHAVGTDTDLILNRWRILLKSKNIYMDVVRQLEWSAIIIVCAWKNSMQMWFTIKFLNNAAF